MADDDKKRFEEYESFRKSRQASESDFIDQLEQQLDIGKQISNQYRETVKSLDKVNDRMDKTKEAIRIQNRIIADNNIKIRDIGKEIEKNKDRISQIGELESENNTRIASERKLIENTSNNIVKTMQTLARVSNDLTKQESIRNQLTKDAENNANTRADIAKRLLDINKNIAYAEENGLDTGEAYETLLKSRQEFLDQESKLKTKGLLLDKQFSQSEQITNGLMVEKQELLDRQIKQENAIAAAQGRIEALESNSINLSKEKLELENKNVELGKQQVALQEENKKRQQDKEVKERMLVKLAELRNKLGAQLILWKMVQMAYDRFVALDKAAEDFRRTTGFTVGQMAHIRKYAEEINVQFADMGVSIEQAYKSAAALANVFGRASLISKDAMMNVSLLSQNLGVAEEVSAQVLENFMGIGKSSEAAAFDTIKLGSVLSEKTGVPFAKVMDDVAKASETTINMIGGSPAKLMKAAIAARALGLDINKIAASQRKLLDFTSSINDELELSALLGKSVSFQKARQLAYEGKSDEALKATLETVKKAGDFEKMNVYQREQLAKAAGMELKDLSKALAVEKQRDEILNGADEEKRQQLLMQEEELKKMKERSEEDEKDLIRQNQKALAQQKMQGVMTKLKNIMDSLSIAFADVLEPVITALSDFVVPLFKVIVGVLKFTIIPLFKLMAYPLKVIGEGVGWIGKQLDSWLETTKPVKETFKEISDWLDTTAGKVTKFLVGGGLLGLFLAGKLGFGGIGKALSGSFGLLKTGLSKIPGLGGLGGAGKAVEGASKIGKSGGGLGSSLGKGIATFMKYVAKGISYFGNTNVLKGALGIALVGASIIPFAFAMKMFADVDWSAVGIGALALVGFTAAAFGLGLLLSTGAGAVVFGAGVLGIAALGMALIPFGVAAIAAGFGIKLLGEGISGAVDPILRLSEIDLTKTALGIGAIGAALAAFGAGSAGAGLGSFVGNLLGGDPIAKMERLAKVGPDLLITASAINMLSSAFQKFNEVDAFAKSIDVLTVSIGKMNDELEKTSLLKLTAIAAMTAASNITGGGGGATAGGTGGGDGIVEKLDAIHEALVGGKVAVYVDGIKVSKAIAQTS